MDAHGVASECVIRGMALACLTFLFIVFELVAHAYLH
jgi:hypothetical protein